MGKIAFIFPGQGSQHVDMGKKMAMAFPQAALVFREAADLLGWPVDRLCFEGPEEKLARTEFTQPAIFTVSWACHLVLTSHGVKPQGVAGHSLGEYTALVAAGSLSFADGLNLVARRAEIMTRAYPPGRGGMAAILGLPSEKVIELCRGVKEGVVEAVNFNCPGQVVVAGQSRAVEVLLSRALEAGAKVIPLAVSGPFHSSLMKTAAQEFAPWVYRCEIKEPALPLVANVTADYVHTPEEIRENLIRQVYSPVRWEDSIRRLIKDGFDIFIEVGPGNVLTGLLKRISREVLLLQVQDPETLEKTLAKLEEAK